MTTEETTSTADSISDGDATGRTDAPSVGASQTRQYETTFAYRLFVLVTTSYPVLQVVFMSMYLNGWWFGYDVSNWVIPAVLLCLPVGHLILLMLESPGGCRFFFPVRKGMPLVIYRKWLLSSDSAVAIGRRQIAIDLIDEAWLTIWGNLHLRSRSIRGKEDLLKFRHDEQSDLLLRLPLGMITLQSQRDFISLLRARKPEIVLNNRLQRRLETPILPGADRLPLIGSIFMLLVLFDAGQALFGHLEILKSYYQADLKAREADTKQADEYLKKGDAIREQKLKWSWVYRQFIARGKLCADMLTERSDVLTRLKRYKEALADLNQAVDEYPGSLKTRVRAARLLYQTGDFKGAVAELEKAIEDHKSAFLPRLYMVTFYRSLGKEQAAETFYKTCRQDLVEEVYGEEPVWPPGGNRFVHDAWFSEDLDFVFDKLFKTGK